MSLISNFILHFGSVLQVWKKELAYELDGMLELVEVTRTFESFNNNIGSNEDSLSKIMVMANKLKQNVEAKAVYDTILSLLSRDQQMLEQLSEDDRKMIVGRDGESDAVPTGLEMQLLLRGSLVTTNKLTECGHIMLNSKREDLDVDKDCIPLVKLIIDGMYQFQMWRNKDITTHFVINLVGKSWNKKGGYSPGLFE